VTEPTLIPLTRPPDHDPQRSEAREQAAQALERLAAQVRADDGEKRFYAWSQEISNLSIESPGRDPLEAPNARLTAIRITWRKE
jgi:hypothetical protein